MKNIILQHWSGELNELTKLSSKSISEYAEMVGADYELVRGDQFTSMDVRPELQKLVMLDKRWDDYDNVVMVDADMFVRKGCNENIFECKGIGRHTQIQTNLRSGIARTLGFVWGNEGAPYWGGSIYKLTKEQRKKFRSVFGATRFYLCPYMYEVCTFNIWFKRRIVPHLSIKVVAFLCVGHSQFKCESVHDTFINPVLFIP